MDINEFRDRTKAFLGDTSIESYGEHYEPAYMELDYVDKDDFCKALKNEVVRRIVTGFSEYVVKSRVKLQNATQDRKDFAETIEGLSNQNKYLREKLSLIQTVCDRALLK
jgi:hypothetical protein